MQRRAEVRSAARSGKSTPANSTHGAVGGEGGDLLVAVAENLRKHVLGVGAEGGCGAVYRAGSVGQFDRCRFHESLAVQRMVEFHEVAAMRQLRIPGQLEAVLHGAGWDASGL